MRWAPLGNGGGNGGRAGDRVELGSHRIDGPMQPGLHRAHGHAERGGGIGCREVEVVAEDDDRPQLGRDAPERVGDLVVVRQAQARVRDRGIDRDQVDLDDAPTATSRLSERGIGQQPMEPGVELIGIAKSGQVSPGFQQGLLDDVPSELDVPDDHPGGRVQARDRGASQHGEGVMIAPPCPLDEAPLVHVCPSFVRDAPGRADRVWRRASPGGSVFGAAATERIGRRRLHTR